MAEVNAGVEKLGESDLVRGWIHGSELCLLLKLYLLLRLCLLLRLYLLLNWKRLRAFGRPGFFRSTLRASRVSIPLSRSVTRWSSS